jgi:hypothetical protein
MTYTVAYDKCTLCACACVQNVLTKYMSDEGIGCYNHYDCRSVFSGSGH